MLYLKKMNLNRLLNDINNLLIGAVTPSNEINNVGEVAQSKYKLAIESGSSSESDTRCIVNFIVGISCDTHEELLTEIGRVVYLLRRKQTTDTGNRERIELDSNAGFQIFTPESGKWIANLKFMASITYDFSEYINVDRSIYSAETMTETINYNYV